MKMSIKVLMLYAIIGSFASQLWSFLLPLYLVSLGADMTQVGFVESLGMTVSLVSSLPVSYISDAYGRKGVIVIGGFLRALLLFSLIFPRTWLEFAAIYALYCLASSYGYVLMASVSEALPERDLATGLSLFNILTTIGFALAMLTGGYFMRNFGFTTNLLISSILILFTSYLIQKYFLETLHVRTRNGKGQHIHDFFGRLRRIVSMPQARLMLFLIIVSNFFTRMTSPYHVVYAEQIIGMTETELGIVYSASQAVGIVSMLIGGKIADKLGRKRIYVLSLAFSPIATLIFLLSYSPTLASIAIVLGSLFSSFMAPAFLAIMAYSVPANMRSVAFSIYSIVPEVIEMPAPILGGILYQEVGPQWPFYLGVFSSYLCVILALKLRESNPI
ncbi:MAG: MFS transporter [Candidatus Brockarchaeota archaeon]|nr:MFS transporter [Candidatus Brockarchaeota archaeon]